MWSLINVIGNTLILNIQNLWNRFGKTCTQIYVLTLLTMDHMAGGARHDHQMHMTTTVAPDVHVHTMQQDDNAHAHAHDMNSMGGGGDMLDHVMNLTTGGYSIVHDDHQSMQHSEHSHHQHAHHAVSCSYLIFLSYSHVYKMWLCIAMISKPQP